MMPNDPLSKEAARDIARLLRAGAADASSLELAAELSRLLDSRSVPAIEGTVDDALAAGELDAADAILLQTERAAQLAGAETIRLWARIRRGLIAVTQANATRGAALLEDAVEQVDELGAPGEIWLINECARASDWLYERAISEERFAEARERLTRMLELARAAHAGDMEARIVLKLLWTALSMGDLASAESHALTLVDGLWRPLLTGDPATSETTLHLLRSVVSSLYGAGDTRYDSARKIARSVVTEAGPDGSMLLVLATAAFSQEDFGDALTWLDRLLAAPEELLPGYEVKQLHHRRALCLLQLGRPRDARKAIETAVKIDPTDPYLRFATAQIFEHLGDRRRAIDAYAEAVRLCDQRMAMPPTGSEPRAGPRSLKEYESSTPVEDLRDFALIRQALALRATGDRAQATAAMELLLSIGDEVSQSTALVTLATWAEEEERLNDAVRLLERAQSLPSSGEVDKIGLQLASALIGLGEFDRAVEALVPLCHKSRVPEACIELLNRIPQSWTGYQLVLRQRGYATAEAGWPREGFAELTAAVEADPLDAEALLLRALARITFGVQEDQEQWNQSRSMRHIRESLQDLYAALRIRPGHEETLRVLKWIVERVAANPGMFEIFSMGGSPEGDLFAAFPHLRSAFEASWRANTLSFRRQFAQALHELTDAQLIHERAGFKILAARISIRLADVYLRLLDLDEVATHLADAEQLIFLVNVPLSLDVLAQYEDFVANRGQLQAPTMGREVEYVWIYDHTAYDQMKLEFVKANYRHRVGDIRGAVECVDLLEPVLNELAANVEVAFGVEEVLWTIAVLRDAGRYDDALHLLDSLQPLPAAKPRSFDLLYMRGLIYDARGEPLLAIESYERALAIVDKALRPVGMAPYVQYAASLVGVGRPADALHALERIDLEHEARSDRDRLYYHITSAWVHGSNGALPEALEAIEKAIPIIEETRAEILEPASRREWQGQQHNLFSIAVGLYAQAGQARRAWEIVELSRARTLLDELVGSESVSLEHDALVAQLETIEQAIRLTERSMEQSATDAAATALRAEAAVRLSALLAHGFEDILSSPAFTSGDSHAVREALLERRRVAMERERTAREQAARPTGAVLDFSALTEILED
jgi:tetratricopeptide (TPR) repeat protein